MKVETYPIRGNVGGRDAKAVSGGTIARPVAQQHSPLARVRLGVVAAESSNHVEMCAAQRSLMPRGRPERALDDNDAFVGVVAATEDAHLRSGIGSAP